MSLPFLQSPAEVMAKLLVDEGWASDPDDDPVQPWPAYSGGEPPLPDDCITVKDTTPVSHGRQMIDGEQWDHFGCQVRVRSQDQPTGFPKAESLRINLSQAVYEKAVDLATDAGTASYVVHSFDGVKMLAGNKNVPNDHRQLFFINVTFHVRRTA